MAEKLLRCTKKKVYFDIVGSPKDLPTDMLPTKMDILKYYVCLQENAFETIIKKTLQIWNEALIPTVSNSRVKQCLKKVHDSYRNISKCYNASKNDSKFQVKLAAFKRDQNDLFDISACKCGEECKCCTSKKVPEALRPFLKDQRSDRLMNMNLIREIILHSRQFDATDIIRQQGKSNGSTYSDDDCFSDDESFTDDPTDPDFRIRQSIVQKIRTKSSAKYNTMNIDPIAIVCDRYGISDPAGAAISSAALQSAGLVTEDDPQLVIDKNKLKRAREKVGNQLYLQRDDEIVGLYFDGRKDRTMTMEVSEDGVAHKRFKKEEHISVIGEPFGKYLGHIALKRGLAVNICDGILEKFGNIDFSAIGSDGTVTNTGHTGGIIRLIEERLDRPLQWLICQLHLNELPFKALFTALDGDTSSPSDFKGPIGKSLSHSLNLPPVQFLAISTKVPDFEGDIKTLSTDQLYLYEMCKAVSSGTCSISLSNRNPGAISNSRWLTIANHLLRTYIGTKDPAAELIELVTYILNVYAPVWFSIKRNWKCIDGPANLFKLIKESRYLSEENRNIVDESIQRNGFFAHHENLMLAMIRDKKKKIRQLAFQRISKARKNRDKKSIASNGVRQFVVPEIKFDAKNYNSLINWTKTQVTEPPLTMKFSLQDLQTLAECGQDSALWKSERFSIPCHTQAVERCVKMVTECSAQVTSKRRDGCIRAKLKSRSIMPLFTSKSKYKLQKI